jgi:hypothetical protein
VLFDPPWAVLGLKKMWQNGLGMQIKLRGMGDFCKKYFWTALCSSKMQKKFVINIMSYHFVLLKSRIRTFWKYQTIFSNFKTFVKISSHFPSIASFARVLALSSLNRHQFSTTKFSLSENWRRIQNEMIVIYDDGLSTEKDYGLNQLSKHNKI